MMGYNEAMHLFRIPVCAGTVMIGLAALGFGLSGCATVFTSSSDRVSRCVALQKQIYADKHTYTELRSACVKWEGQKQLSDDGKWSGKQTATG